MLLRLAHFALAAVLLVGWQAALQHPVEHVDGFGRFVHVQDGHSQDGDSKAGSLCDLLAALAACATQAHSDFSQLHRHYESPSYPPSAPRAAEAPPFLSQGPPASV